MVIPTKINPPDEPKEPKDALGKTDNDSSAAKTTAPMTDDGSKKPFKEVLNSAMSDKQLKTPVKPSLKPDDEDDELLSLLELAGQTKSREVKSKASVTNTAGFTPASDSDTPVAKGSFNTEIAAVTDDSVVPMPDDDSAQDTVKVVRDTDVKQTLQPLGKEPLVKDPSVVQTADSSTKVVDKKPDHALHGPDVTKKEIPPVSRKLEDTARPTEDLDPKVAFHEQKTKKVDLSNPNTTVVAAAPHVAQPVQAAAPTPQVAPVSNARETLLKLAQSMVDQIQLVKSSGQTDTTFTLKQPPMFEGVTVKITEFDSSQKQFNVAFGDVNNPTARALIEQQDNQVRLQQALLDRGYTVQMVTVDHKIPGLASAQTGEAKLGQQGRSDAGDQAGTATDQDDGDVT